LDVTVECIESSPHVDGLQRHKYVRGRRYAEHYCPRSSQETSDSGNASRHRIARPSALLISTVHANAATVGACGTLSFLKSAGAGSLLFYLALNSHLLRVDSAMLWLRENARRVRPLRWNSSKIASRSAGVLLLCFFFLVMFSVSMRAAYRYAALFARCTLLTAYNAKIG
jgi:hypothetical protein